MVLGGFGIPVLKRLLISILILHQIFSHRILQLFCQDQVNVHRNVIFLYQESLLGKFQSAIITTIVPLES